MIPEDRKKSLRVDLENYCIDQLENTEEYFICQHIDGEITSEELQYINALTIEVVSKE